jgi:hypothetical protein
MAVSAAAAEGVSAAMAGRNQQSTGENRQPTEGQGFLSCGCLQGSTKGGRWGGHMSDYMFLLGMMSKAQEGCEGTIVQPAIAGYADA